MKDTMEALALLSNKERQIRAMDALVKYIAPYVSNKMSATHGPDWQVAYEAKESQRRNSPFTLSLEDIRALLRILRHERAVFPEVDASQRAWIDELIQATNLVAHTAVISEAQAERAIDTAALLAQSLGLTEYLDDIAELTPTDKKTSMVPFEVQDSASAAAALGTPGHSVLGISTEKDGGPGLNVMAQFRDAINFALVHNHVSPITLITVSNSWNQDINDVTVEFDLEALRADLAFGAPLRIPVGTVPAGQTVELGPGHLGWRLRPAAFVALTESTSTQITMRVTAQVPVATSPAVIGSAVTSTATTSTELKGFQSSSSIRVLTANEWWALSIPESLAAFVRPNDPAIQQIISATQELLLERTTSSALEGYQAGPERVYQIAEAIYDAMAAQNLNYVEVPPSFEGTGQRIRTHAEVLSQRQGNCLDLSCLYAAALEYAGLNPVLCVVEGHAFTGYLTEDTQLPSVALDSATAIRSIGDSELFDAVELTALAAGSGSASFDVARGKTRAWWGAKINQFDYMLDVARAHRIVKPLPNILEQDGVLTIETVREVEAPAARKIPRTTQAASAAGSSAPDSAAQAAPIPPRVNNWRRSLLDLSYNNPLLKLKQSSSVTLHCPSGALAKFEDKVAGGEVINLLPSDQLAQIHQAQGARSAGDIDAEALNQILVDENTLHTNLTSGQYATRLKRLVRNAKLSLEETGTDNLYLAFGTLHWEERGRQGEAPLFLQPIKITAGAGSRPFRIELDTSRDTQPNYCLIEKLRASWNIELPELADPGMDESGIDIVGALAAIRSRLVRSHVSDFHVEETAHLALLQFSTLEMWRDLTDNWQAFEARPAVQHLIHSAGSFPFDDQVPPPEPAPDAEATTFLPILADGSQIEAIRWAAAGKSFILEGPPGTGKSQTITNLIAHLLAQGKKVLFVAEKQAALEVVQRRLDSVGLDPFTLDIHGKKQSPNVVKQQLNTALEQILSASPSWETKRATYRSLVENLAQYPVQLHEAGPADLSTWDAHQVILELAHEVTSEPLKLPRSVALLDGSAEHMYTLARDLAQALAGLGVTPQAAPWRIAGPARFDYLDREGLSALVARLDRAHKAVASAAIKPLLTDVLSDAHQASLEAWLTSQRYGYGKSAVEAQQLVTPQWEAYSEQVLTALNRFVDTYEPQLGEFSPAVVSADLAAAHTLAQEADAKFFGKKKRRRQVVNMLAAYLPDAGESLDLKTLTATVDGLRKVADETTRITAFIRTLAGLNLPYDFNPLAQGQAEWLTKEIETLRTTAQLVRFNASNAKVSPTETAEYLDQLAEFMRSSPTDTAQANFDVAQEFQQAWSQLLQILQTTGEDLEFWLAGRDRFTALDQDLMHWTADATNNTFIALQRWLRVRGDLDQLSQAGGTEVVARIRANSVPTVELEAAMRLGVTQEILHERLESTGLATFDERQREATTDRFLSSGDEVRAQLRSELPARVVAARKFDVNQRAGHVAELRAQLNRRRGGMTVRQLLQTYGTVITQITPCFLMSPGSVARFLPANGLDFDVVVFDEASQIRVPDAIGAMGRGKAVVIVGDSKQMPPSSTFAASIGDSPDQDADDLPVPSDMDSILSEAVESRFPSQWLSWHYRSRDESLIAFSNQTYYEGRLSSFPSPPQESQSSVSASSAQLGSVQVGGAQLSSIQAGSVQAGSVQLVNVHGTWEGGNRAARVNRTEASAVVQEVQTLLATDPSQSIAVVTFNTQQRDLILDSLEELSGTNSLVFDALNREDEPLVVKNLENVQGDERDIILFTLAFSKNENGRVPLNWGPLSRVGGEKRLNVAVTRAKSLVKVFCSFEPHELDLGNSTSLGLAHLKEYLLLAKNGADSVLHTRSLARDRHLEEIANHLEAQGLEVKQRVGLSDFTVDLAIRFKDCPWVAVLLDSPTWASRQTVGDRDGLPKTVLMGSMGWADVERVWLPTWLRDRNSVTATLLSEAKNAKEKPKPKPVAATPAEEQSATESETSALTQSLLASVSATLAQSATPAAKPAPISYRPAEELDFEPASIAPQHKRDLLDSHSSAALGAINEQVQQIIATESPILLDRAVKILAHRFDLSAVRESRREQLEKFFPRDQTFKAPNGDQIVWATAADRHNYTSYRVPTNGEQRDLYDVPYDELANAMIVTVRDAIQLAEDDVLRETARRFGVNTLTKRVRDRLQPILQLQVLHHQLTQSDNAYSIPEAKPDLSDITNLEIQRGPLRYPRWHLQRSSNDL
ncbi:DUF4011 domain-containing protein [Jonesiaceae bacterium BS-20]|uniref:DUF4011 domain-containing protein n=1 Tax=Jonesiaceae bacterium BS-20 TaxID=3120821 RepID=A0AAU7DSX2_9MICO